MSRYGPRVAPTERDPLAEAINALRGSFGQASQSAQDRQRQARLDQERAEDRTFQRGQVERSNELQDLDLHERGFRRGTAPAEMPQHEVRPMEDDDLAATFEALRTGGFQRPQPEPAPAAPGAFVPGVGFNLRYNAARTPPPVHATDMEPGGFTPTGLPAANLGERKAPRFQQATENFYQDTTATPEARAAAREAEQERMILERLLAHPEIDETEAPLIARGQMSFRDARDPEPEEPGRYQPTTREQWLADQAALAELREGGEDGVNPTTLEVGRRNRALAAASALNRIETYDDERGREERARREAEILRYYGFDSVDQLFNEMRRFGGEEAPEGGEGRRTVITQDQADYLRQVEGMTDEQIQAQYEVR